MTTDEKLMDVAELLGRAAVELNDRNVLPAIVIGVRRDDPLICYVLSCAPNTTREEMVSMLEGCLEAVRAAWPIGG